MFAFHGTRNPPKTQARTQQIGAYDAGSAHARTATENLASDTCVVVKSEMSGDRVIGSSPAQREGEEVRWIVIIVPLVVSVVLFVSVVAYRCRAHRIRHSRIAQEREQELCEMKAARNMETGGEQYLDNELRGAAKAGLGSDYYMSAYKKLIQQA